MMRTRSRWQFSLFTVFVVTAVVAVGIVLWQRFPVTGVSLSGTDVVLHMSDDYGRQTLRKMLQGDPWFDAMNDSPDVFFHDAYVKVPVYFVIGGLLIVAGMFVALFVAIRRWR